MLDVDGALLAKLAIRGGLDGSPSAIFSEMVVKHETTGAPFLLADWSSLPAVGGISIIEMFNLRLHPLRLQIERRTGRRIKEYIFSRPQRNDSKDQDVVDDLPVQPRNSLEPPTPVRQDFPKGHQLLTRATSQQNPPYKTLTESADQRPRRLRKTPSSERLRKSRTMEATTELGTHQLEVDAPSNPDVEEMRVRARQNRTFLHIQVSSLLCVLSYKHDTPLTLMPDLEDFKFQTPRFEYTNKIWSFEEAFNAMKKDLFREIWRQKGALIREFASRAKLVTPRNFLTEPTATSSHAPSGSQTPAHSKWRHVFPHSRPATPLNISRTVEPPTPVELESTQINPANSSIVHPRPPAGPSHNLSHERATQSEGLRGRRRSLLRKRPPMDRHSHS